VPRTIRQKRKGTQTMNAVIKIKKDGFQNSFDEYILWCDSQEKKELPTVSWGLWWEMIKNNEEEKK